MNRRDALKFAAVFPIVAKALADTPPHKTPDMPTIEQIRTSPDHFKNAVEAATKALISKRPDAKIWRLHVQMGRSGQPGICCVYIDDNRCFVTDQAETTKPRPVQRGPEMVKIRKENPNVKVLYRTAAFCVDFREPFSDTTEFIHCINHQINKSIEDWQFTGLYSIIPVNAYDWRT